MRKIGKYINNVRDYIFYRAYLLNKKKNLSEGFCLRGAYMAISSIDYLLPLTIVCILLFSFANDINIIAKRHPILPITLVGMPIIYVVIHSLIVDRIYERKIREGWLDEMQKRYGTDNHIIPGWVFVILPPMLLLAIPMLLAAITGTGEWFPKFIK